MTNGYSGRAKHEIAHGKLLATADTETIWGWGTPSGHSRAKAILKVLQDKKLSKKLGENGKERVKRFSIEENVRKTEQVYLELLNSESLSVR